MPEEIAPVGVDNDDLLCELARLSLTNVALSAERVGFDAARPLGRLLKRPRPRGRPVRIETCRPR